MPIWLIALIVAAFQAASPAPKDNARLDVFMGSWNAAGTGSGTATYRWDSQHRWLIYQSRFELANVGAYEVKGAVGYDADGKRYRAWAFNSMGAAIEYAGDWQDENTLVLTSTSETGRVVYTRISTGRIRFVSSRRISSDVYEPYFDVVFSTRSNSQGR